MNFNYSCQTNQGEVRESNQDSLLVKSGVMNGHSVLLAAICDGVGGLSQGEWCSRRAVELLSSWFVYELPQIMEQSQLERLLQYRLRQLIADINWDIYTQNRRNSRMSGTTLTVLLLWDYRYMIAHVGDCRVYAVESGRALCLTKDHSWVAREVEEGRLQPSEARNHPKQNAILRCIGTEPEVEVDVSFAWLSEPTVFILCTDGFWHEVEHREWLSYFAPEVMQQERAMNQTLYEMVQQVRMRGESDNITVIAVSVR